MDKETYGKFIFGTVFMLANKLQVIGDSFLNEVTTKQWFVLLMVSQFQESPPTLGQVAELVGSSHQNVKQLAIKLEQKGFLTISKDGKDSRILRLQITEQCQKYFMERAGEDTKFLNQLYKDFTEEELRQLAKGIYKLAHSIKNVDPSANMEDFGWIQTLFSE